MSKANPFSDGRYALRGTMTREQAVAVAEVLAGSSVLWDRGHTFPVADDKLFVAPARCACGQCLTAKFGPENRERDPVDLPPLI